MKIAIIDDDKPTSAQLRQWVEKAVPGARIDQWYTREQAETAVQEIEYDLISLDISLAQGNERHAGVGILKEATRKRPVPVLVCSGMPADIYRSVMKELDAWDYLQKPVAEQEYIETLLDILKLAGRQKRDDLIMDPLIKAKPLWKGQRLNISATQQRLLHLIYERRRSDDPTVPYEDLVGAILSGKEKKQNVKRQIAQIKIAFKDIEPEFEGIVVEPMRGYRWVDR